MDDRGFDWVMLLAFMLSMVAFLAYIVFLMYAPSCLDKYISLITFLVLMGIPRVCYPFSKYVVGRLRRA